MKKSILFILVLFSAMWVGSTVNAAIIVGRISHVEGQIYRYMDVESNWSATPLQSPVSNHDVLATGDASKTEIVFPNNQMVRLDENTEIEILNLDNNIGEFSLHSGFARFYNRSSSGRLSIETARGTAAVEPGSAVDVLADEQSVIVSAVQGEVIFHSYQDGVEKVEIISGGISLEFREKSIIAGIGPFDRKWDRWCADREGVLTKNRLVRSEHLPESMQEYAHTMEPYGRWQRIFYRGYYYWAWKPHSVAVGWSPYTTGHWDDWHGSSVWIDYNPWGWVTHHHGQWLNMHGGWLWTPYVHVSHVPGVTAIGFNIRFGKRYRPHWHPGRVRWIAHNDYIGWLPLAPWETNYGYRKWGPDTVVVSGGARFSIDINLSSHKHIDHAVIIPKRNLYHRKPGVMNNYNTVKIKNVNKTVIIKNYKQLPAAEKLRDKKRPAKVVKIRNSEKKNKNQRERNAEKARESIRSENIERKRERSILVQRNMPKERNITSRYEKGGSRSIENKNADGRDKAIHERVVRFERKTHEKTVEKREKQIVKGRSVARDKSRKSLADENRGQKRDNVTGPVQVETSRKRVRAQESITVVSTKKGKDHGKQTGREYRLSQRQVERNQNRDKKAKKENRGKYGVNEESEGDSRERQTGINSHDGKEVSAFRENGASQRPGRDRYSASLNSRRIR